MAERKVPYEFLARWDAQGRLYGAHVGFRTYVARADGNELEMVDPVMPVDIGQGKGFPLAEILDDLQAASLARVEELTAAKAALETAATAVAEEANAAATAAADEIARLEGLVAQLTAANADLLAKLEALQDPTPKLILP